MKARCAESEKNISDDRKVKLLIIQALILADGDVGEAFALIYEIRNSSVADDDVLASTDHFFNCWAVGNHLPPILAGTAALHIGIIYHNMKTFGVPVGQDRPDRPPSPPTWMQLSWKLSGSEAAARFPTNLKGRTQEELMEFLKWLFGQPESSLPPPSGN